MTTKELSPVDQTGFELDEALQSGDPERIELACQAFDKACDERDGLNAENLARINRLSVQLCDVPGYLRTVMAEGTITVLITSCEARKSIPHVFEGVPVKTLMAD